MGMTAELRTDPMRLCYLPERQRLTSETYD